MNLERAILLALSASPRAITANVIRGGLAAFIGGEHTLADVNAALARLEDEGEVKGTASKDFGVMWKETPDGRLRIS